MFVLSRMDFTAFYSSLRRVNHLLLALFAVAFVFASLLADCFGTREVYRRTVCDVSFANLFTIRAASYLPSILNQHLGQVWFTYFLAKVCNAPLWRVAGSTLLVYATLFAGMIVMTALGIPFKPVSLSWLWSIVILIVLGAVYLLVVRARPQFLLKHQVTAPLVEVGVSGHVVLALYRIPHLVVLFFGNWIPFSLFGVHIPFVDALMLIPMVMLVASLPLTPQGVGTRDALALQLFAGYAVGSPSERAGTLVAATLSFAVSVALVALLVSPLFLARTRRLLPQLAGSARQQRD